MPVITEPRLCACGCGRPLPEGSTHMRRTATSACRSRLSAAAALHNERRRAERHEAAARARAELGTRVCAAPGCEVDISDRDPRTRTCRPAHRVALTLANNKRRAAGLEPI